MVDFSFQNTCNRANGSLFEQLIDAALEYYWEKGYACIQKTPEPMRVIKNNSDGTFTSVYTKKAQPDYKGVLLGGQSIIFEAKYTSCDRINQSVVTKEQVKMFEQYQKMGAKCYVMVCIQDVNYYRIPWDVWTGMKDIFGHKYMTYNELELYRVKETKGIVLLLEGIELLEYI